MTGKDVRHAPYVHRASAIIVAHKWNFGRKKNHYSSVNYNKKQKWLNTKMKRLVDFF